MGLTGRFLLQLEAARLPSDEVGRLKRYLRRAESLYAAAVDGFFIGRLDGGAAMLEVNCILFTAMATVNKFVDSYRQAFAAWF